MDMEKWQIIKEIVKENKRNGFGVGLSPRKYEGDKIYMEFWEKNNSSGTGILLNKKTKREWKNNKISKQFYDMEEFIQSTKQLGLKRYIFFFERAFDKHFSIIKNIINHVD